MKKLFTATATFLALYSAANAYTSQDIETKLTSQGTIKSTINEVQASGWDLRTVSWIEMHTDDIVQLYSLTKKVEQLTATSKETKCTKNLI